MAGHWARDCPLKTPTKPTTIVASPPVIHCPCDGGACLVLTSKTEKNPNRRFYTCSAVPSCGFFKRCDQVSIKSDPISVNPTCSCGSGPCRRVTVIDGPNAHRSYFVCCIKKLVDSFNGKKKLKLHCFSEFDSADGEKLLPETDLNSYSNVKTSRLGMVLTNEFTFSISVEKEQGNKVFVDGIAQPLKDYAETLGEESIYSRFNNLDLVSNGVFSSEDGRNQVYKEAVHFETEKQVLSSIASKHIESQVESFYNDHLTNSDILKFGVKRVMHLK
ncbi:unnamed protein product [Thlaspi arvense]|uniref:GRF-type domain-containing protein n=1 Tax=Thlaspi arvense TaxID=13288 RepID=A0AAU9RNZ6_THLAR|nr:unnamed protein product [Thlaspi arvense]